MSFPENAPGESAGVAPEATPASPPPSPSVAEPPLLAPSPAPVPPCAPQAVPASLPYSGLGIASFVLSMTAGLVFMAAFAFAALARTGQMAPADPTKITGLIAVASLPLGFVALALGIASLLQPGRNRTFGILGVIFSALQFLVFVVLTLFGLALKLGGHVR